MRGSKVPVKCSAGLRERSPKTFCPFCNSIQSFCIYSLGFSLVVSQHVAALLSSQAGVNDANKTSHQSIFYPHHCICKTTINYKASQKSSENPSTVWHLHCAPSLERTGQYDVCHSLYLYPAVYLKRCGQTVENHSRAKDTDRSHFFFFSTLASRSYGHAL